MKLAPILALAALVTWTTIPTVDCGVTSSVIARLFEAVKARKQMIVDDEQPEIIWSDGAMFEIATKFPPEVQELISGSKAHRNLKPVIARMIANLGSNWKDATVNRSEKGEAYRLVTSSDSTIRATISSAYIDYLRERYPSARIRIKSDMDPVVFMVSDVMRGAVMPIRM